MAKEKGNNHDLNHSLSVPEKSGAPNKMRGNVLNAARQKWHTDRTLLLFAFDGILITLINNFINNNNNLFATHMGATDFQVSLVTALPQFVGMLVLIPGGLWTDRMTNKRRMVIMSLVLLAAVYAVIGFVPWMGDQHLNIFILLLSVSLGPMTMYTASWQAYFSDVVPIDDRNRIYTVRTRGTFFVGVVAPLVTGALLASASANEQKIWYHQCYFWAACVLLLFQIVVIASIRGGNAEPSQKIGIREFMAAISEMAHNRRYIGFVAVALFFYMVWQSDWTLYYLGQVNYLKLNEAWLSYATVGGALVQFLTIGFWSRVNNKMGVRFSIIIGTLALSLFPICMIVSTSVDPAIGAPLFLVMNTLSNFAFASIFLNIMQCLLQVVPEKNKTLYISVYTVLVTLSNAVMPIVGVQIYTALGSNLWALHAVNYILFAARIVAALMWTIRWWLMRHEP